MDYFKKLERTLKLIGDEDNIKTSQFHLKKMLIHCNKQPHEINNQDINSYLNTLKNINEIKQASILKLFYFTILKR